MCLYFVEIAAHELRAWLLHYSPVVLYKILPNAFYQHYLLLVEGVYLLLKDSIRELDIQRSELVLKKFPLFIILW